MTKVKIDTPGVTVEIEADDSAAVLVERALKLYKDAGGWPQSGNGAGTGFQVERMGREASSVMRRPMGTAE